MKRSVLSLLLIAGIVVANEDPRTVSFAKDVLPIFMDRCAFCHLPVERYGYLSFTPQNTYESIVGVASYQQPDYLRIAPGDPQSSYIWLKITGEYLKMGGRGWPMPPMEKLSKSETEKLYQWISLGAVNN